jgi:hypothetical protein
MLLRRMNAAFDCKEPMVSNYKNKIGYRDKENMCKEISKCFCCLQESRGACQTDAERM